MKVIVLRKGQARELYLNKFAPDSFFNPVLDKDMNIIISEQEQSRLISQGFDWLAELPLIEQSQVYKDLTPAEWLLEDKNYYQDKIAEIDSEIGEIGAGAIK